MVMIQIMRLVTQKYLLMSSKIKKIKELEHKIKEKEEKSNKKIKELDAKIKELKDKTKNSTTNQITNNFGKIDDVKHEKQKIN